MNKNFNDSDFTLLLEIARIALGNGPMFKHLAEELDLNEIELENFEQKVQKECNRH